MDNFLDLLEAFHWFCVRHDVGRLETCEMWLVPMVRTPNSAHGWRAFGTQALDWLKPQPPGWDPNWRILSAHERTLTVEALEYLEAQRPGAISAALPSAAAGPGVFAPLAAVIPNIHEDWGLDEVVKCLVRELERREAKYPGIVKAGRLSAERAGQEIGQMRAALRLAQNVLEQSRSERQRSLFRSVKRQG